MSTPKIAIVFYSTYGTNVAVAKDAKAAAEAAGAEVRLLRVAETAPAEVVAGQDPWKANLDSIQDIPVATPDDIAWADGYFFSFPTRFGSAASQFRAFIDTLGGVWSQGGMANKTVTATTSAQNVHGGQESTLLGFYTSTMHWGSIIVAPGYTDPAHFKSGGNPYGTSITQGDYSEEKIASVKAQATRLVEITKKIIA